MGVHVDICVSNTRRERRQTCTPYQVFITAYTPISRILPHVIRRRSRGFIRRRKIALMERAHLVRLERANGCVHHATIMEQDQVLFFPVVRVHQLEKARRKQDGTEMMREKNKSRKNAHSARWRGVASCTKDRALPLGP